MSNSIAYLDRPAPVSGPRRDHILDAAERLFAERGFAATSMRTLAQETAANVATLYYHCGNKEQLFAAIYARAIGRLFDFVKQTLSSGDDFAVVAGRVIDQVVEYFAKNPSVARLMLRSRLGETPGGKWTRDSYEPLFEMAAVEMARRAEAGQIRRVDAATFADAAAGVILHLAVDLARSDGGAKGNLATRLRTAQDHARLFVLGALGLDPVAGRGAG